MIRHLLTSEINEENVTVYLNNHDEYAAKISDPRIYK